MKRMVDSSKLVRGSKGISPSKIDKICKEVQDDILDAASAVLRSPEFGFTLDEISDYLFVDVRKVDGGAIEVEVRCELDYDDMAVLANKLDDAVQRYDKDAYFDFVTPGIVVAYLANFNSVMQSVTINSGLNVDFILTTLEQSAKSVKDRKGMSQFIRKVAKIYPDKAKEYRRMVKEAESDLQDLVDYSLFAGRMFADMKDYLKGTGSHVIKSSRYDLPDFNLDPPEDTRLVEDGMELEIKFHLNEVIQVSAGGDWDLVERAPEGGWRVAKHPRSFRNPSSSDGSWYFDEYEVLACDPDSLADDTCDIIYKDVPSDPGLYRIEADMVMCYYTDYVYISEDKYDRYPPDVETDVNFDSKNSYAHNIHVSPV